MNNRGERRLVQCCEAAGGCYMGDGTSCDPNPCGPVPVRNMSLGVDQVRLPIPEVSGWLDGICTGGSWAVGAVAETRFDGEETRPGAGIPDLHGLNGGEG